jgi:hypothetical protein
LCSPNTYPADFSRQRGLVDKPRINHDRFFNTLTEHRLRAVLTVDMPNLACVAGKLDGFVQQRPRRGGHVPALPPRGCHRGERRNVTEQAATAAIEQGCRMLRLPTIRDRFAEIATAAEREQSHKTGQRKIRQLAGNDLITIDWAANSE